MKLSEMTTQVVHVTSEGEYEQVYSVFKKNATPSLITGFAPSSKRNGICFLGDTTRFSDGQFSEIRKDIIPASDFIASNS